MFFASSSLKTVEFLLDHYSPMPCHFAMPKVDHLPPVKCPPSPAPVKRPLPVICSFG